VKLLSFHGSCSMHVVTCSWRRSAGHVPRGKQARVLLTANMCRSTVSARELRILKIQQDVSSLAICGVPGKAVLAPQEYMVDAGSLSEPFIPHSPRR
jgi:hypothetical protein